MLVIWYGVPVELGVLCVYIMAVVVVYMYSFMRQHDK